MGAFPTGGVTFRQSQPSEPNVVDDHIRLRQHQIGVVACIGLCIGARHMKHTCTTEAGETVGGGSGSGELSSGEGSAS